MGSGPRRVPVKAASGTWGGLGSRDLTGVRGGETRGSPQGSCSVTAWRGQRHSSMELVMCGEQGDAGRVSPWGSGHHAGGQDGLRARSREGVPLPQGVGGGGGMTMCSESGGEGVRGGGRTGCSCSCRYEPRAGAGGASGLGPQVQGVPLPGRACSWPSCPGTVFCCHPLPRVPPADRPSGPSCPHPVPSGASPYLAVGQPGACTLHAPFGGPLEAPLALYPAGRVASPWSSPGAWVALGPGSCPQACPSGWRLRSASPCTCPGAPSCPRPRRTSPVRDPRAPRGSPPSSPASPSPLWGFLGSWVWGACPAAPAAPWPCPPRWAVVT